MIQKEPAENVAVILAYLPTEQSRKILESLPPSKKTEVTSLLATSREVLPEVLSRVNREMKKKIDFIVDGTERLSAILDQSDKATRDEILEFLGKKDPELAARIKKSIFTFENVIELEKDDLQKVLREVSLDVLGFALRGVDDNFREQIFKKISEGAASMLKQELELSGTIPKKKIEDAQHDIVGIVRKLEKEGAVEIRRKEAPANAGLAAAGAEKDKPAGAAKKKDDKKS